MSDNTCKTCKWWGSVTGEGSHVPEFDPEQRFCVRAFGWNKTHPHQPDGPEFDTVGYEDVDCPPTVPPDFGCIHHESR